MPLSPDGLNDPRAGEIVGLIAGWAAGVTSGLSAAAFYLRTSCRICGVRPPDYAVAWFICLLEAVALSAISGAFYAAVVLGGIDLSGREKLLQARLIVLGASLPVSFLVSANLLAALLKIPTGRGMAVVLVRAVFLFILGCLLAFAIIAALVLIANAEKH